MPPGGLRKVPNALPRSSRSITIRGAASLRQRTARQEELVLLLRRAPRARIRAAGGAVDCDRLSRAPALELDALAAISAAAGLAFHGTGRVLPGG
jgi:hypothetical protein